MSFWLCFEGEGELGDTCWFALEINPSQLVARIKALSQLVGRYGLSEVREMNYPETIAKDAWGDCEELSRENQWFVMMSSGEDLGLELRDRDNPEEGEIRVGYGELSVLTRETFLLIICEDDSNLSYHGPDIELSELRSTLVGLGAPPVGAAP